MAGWHLGRLYGREGTPGRGSVRSKSPPRLGLAYPTLSGAVTAAAVVPVTTVVVAEAMQRRRTSRLSPVFDRRLVALVVVAGVSVRARPSGSLLCGPESVVQLHGVARPERASPSWSGPIGRSEHVAAMKDRPIGEHRLRGRNHGWSAANWACAAAAVVGPLGPLSRSALLGRRHVRRALVGNASAPDRCRTGKAVLEPEDLSFDVRCQRWVAVLLLQLCGDLERPNA